MILDIIFAAVIIACVVRGAKRGIIKTALSVSSVFVSIVAALLLYNPFMDIIMANGAVAEFIAGIKNAIKTAVLPMVSIESAEETPEILNYLLDSEMLKQGSESIATAIAEAVVYMISIVLFIIFIKLLVTLLFKVFKVTAKLPIIKQANGLCGGLLGIVTGIFLCWIIATVFTLFISSEGFGWVSASLGTSRFAKYLFKSNIIFAILK